MVHDGIEIGMRQAVAEGFALLDGKRDLHLDAAAIAQLWRDADAARSRAQDAVTGIPAHDEAPVLADNGEIRWAVNEAVEQGVHAPVLAMALMARLGGPRGRGVA
jgi:6-phosphogluconate dehydrogenase